MKAPILLALLIALSFGPSLCAQGGSFTPIASSSVVRSTHSATVLSSGKVLLAGGAATPSAELYDPATGSWTPTGAPSVRRRFHTATLLPTGKVLVTGGNGAGITASCELYDPASGTWSATGSMASARWSHTATLLHNGKVLVTGGRNGGQAGCELYDPFTGSWSATGSMTSGRGHHTATLLSTGEVLVIGGTNTGVANIPNCERYDPDTGVWSPAGTLSTPRTGHTVTALAGGVVLVAGGRDGSGTSTTSCERYEVVSGSWSSTGSLGSARAQHTASRLPSGEVLLVAGSIAGTPIAGSEIYDPIAGTWTPDASLGSGVVEHTAVLLPSGKVLVACGAGSSACELYSYGAGSWRSTSPLSIPSNGSGTLTPINGLQMLYVGEQGAELLSLLSESWSATTPMVTPRRGHTATLLSSGEVLVVGGRDQGASPLASCEIYDPETETWRSVGSLSATRLEHTATLLPSGKVLVAGGNAGGTTTGSCELFDPLTETWSSTGSLAGARRGHTATLLPTGEVLAASGYKPIIGVSYVCELYDPATETWSLTGSVGGSAPEGHTATLLPSGKVLLVGSLGQSSQLYDVATGTWSSGAPLPSSRRSHSATLLPSGQVLFAGGRNSFNSPLASCELYDPETDSWITTGNLASNAGGTAALGGRGEVIVVNSQLFAEIFDAGLGFDSSDAPTTYATTHLGDPLVVNGVRFRGRSEGNGGNSRSSSTGHPLVQLRSVESGQVLFLETDGSIDGFTDVSFLSAAYPGFPQGPTWVTVFTNGMPGRPLLQFPIRYPGTEDTLSAIVHLNFWTPLPQPRAYRIQPSDIVSYQCQVGGNLYLTGQFVVFASVIPTGGTVPELLPNAWLDLNAFMYLTNPIPGTSLVLGGFDLSFAYTGGLAGASVILQSAVVAPGLTKNGVYATTHAYELQFQ